jgi:hypothetical protein
MPDETRVENAEFGQPLFGETEFSETPAETLVQTRSTMVRTRASRRVTE